MPSDPRIDELDEPPASARPQERETAPPPFEPGVFAQEIEGAGSRATLPPAPTYAMLRDSCKSMIASDAMTDEIDRADAPMDANVDAVATPVRKPPPVPPRSV